MLVHTPNILLALKISAVSLTSILKHRPVADWAKSAGVEQFLYISSAGIYKPTDEPPHVEGDAVKVDASHVGAEDHVKGLSFSSWAIFRPQYMIGSGNNKDCEEWFFDRMNLYTHCLFVQDFLPYYF